MPRPMAPVEQDRANAAIALVLWAALVAVAVLWGRWLGEDEDIGVGAPPFAGTYHRLFSADVAVPVVAGFGLITLGPPLVDRLWRWLVPPVAGAMAVGWALALQRADDTSLTGPLTTPSGFLATVAEVGTPGEYLHTFVERLPDASAEVRSHPPGTVLVAWGLERIGQPGPEPFLVLVLAVWGLGVAAVCVALHVVAGEAALKRAAVPIALAPAALWVATSVDALFAGVAAVAVALMVVAFVRPPALGADALALAGGALFGGAMLLTYGAVALLAIPAGVAMHRQRIRPVLVATAGAAATLGGFRAAGFWWFDGLAAVRSEYDRGLASDRPYSYFVIANLGVLALSCGPAVAAGLSHVRFRHVDPWLLAAGALVAVLVADLSGLSKGEVERVWLLFVPWAVTVVATTDPRSIPLRLVLLGQVAGAIVLQILLRSPW